MEAYVQDVRASENQTSTRHSGLRADAVSIIIVPPFTTSLLVDTGAFSLKTSLIPKSSLPSISFSAVSKTRPPDPVRDNPASGHQIQVASQNAQQNRDHLCHPGLAGSNSRTLLFSDIVQRKNEAKNFHRKAGVVRVKPVFSLARSGATAVSLRPSPDGCNAIGAGLLKRNPLALQPTGRVAGLKPHATERCEVPKGKSNDDFGHDVLLPAHASCRAAARSTGPGPTRRLAELLYQEGWAEPPAVLEFRKVSAHSLKQGHAL